MLVSAPMTSSSKNKVVGDAHNDEPKDVVSPVAPSVCPSELSTVAPSEGFLSGVGRVSDDYSDIDEHEHACQTLEEQVSEWAEVGDRLSVLFQQLSDRDLDSDDEGSCYSPRWQSSNKCHRQFSAILGVMSHRKGEASAQDDDASTVEDNRETVSPEASEAWNALISWQNSGTDEPEAEHQEAQCEDSQHSTGCHIEDGLNSWCILGSQLAKALRAVEYDDDDDWS